MNHPSKIERNNNRIIIEGDIRNNHAHFLFTNIYHAFMERGYQDILLDFSKCTSVFADTMLSLCSYAIRYKSDGLNIELIIPESQKLERLFINSNWAHLINSSVFKPTSFSGYRQVPATLYHDPEEQSLVLKKIVNSLLMSYEELQRKDFSAIEWSINEIMDNVLVHSRSSYGGLVQMTTYNNINKKIELVVSDGGIGIPSSLKEAYNELDSDVKLLMKSIEEGVTNGKGQGNGLFGTYKICSISGGNFLIDSGGARLYYNEKAGLHVKPNTIPITGTTVVAVINCNGHGTLEKALKFNNIIHNPMDFFDYEMMNTDDDSIEIIINEEVKSVGSRIEGTPLRNKLKNIYSMTEEKIVLNFKGIDIISSSFGDEVIAKLIEDIGMKDFNKRFVVSNVTETIRSLIVKSISQRSHIDEEGIRLIK